jgi:hypothetical protein
MGATYYRLTSDLSYPNRWYLQAPVDGQGNALDPRTFMTGEGVDVVGPIRIGMRLPGEPLSFTLADFDMPVVSAELGAAIEHVAPGRVQRIPIEVLGVAGDFEILNVLQVVDALDHTRSKVTYWQPSDGRPDKVGLPRMIIDLAVDPTRVDEAEIFRLAHWRIALIVSDQVARALAGQSGVQLQPVSKSTN